MERIIRKQVLTKITLDTSLENFRQLESNTCLKRKIKKTKLEMGQKVNPNIFRLGKTKKWKSRYIEKKPIELSTHVFKDLEIKKFICKFLEKRGTAMQDCKLFYTNDTIHVYVSYCIALQTLVLINETNKSQKLKMVYVKKSTRKKKKRKRKSYIVTFKAKNYISNSIPLYRCNKKAKGLFLEQNGFQQVKRLQFLQAYKKSRLVEKFQNINRIEKNPFISRLLETISLFTHKKLDVFVTFNPLHENSRQMISSQKFSLIKKNLLQLRKYKNNFFFREGINLMFVTALKGKFANILAQFIATSFKKLKRHNFFLRFIQTALSFSIKRSLSSNVKGVKIKIKGRFNGTPRAKHKLICIGNGVPALTLNSNIDYSEKTAFTSCGTFGVKIWLIEQ